MTTRIADETVIPRNAIFIPYILAVSPYTEAERDAAALIIPTNTALPMDPDIVRSEDKRAVASATYFLSTLEVPHVISGIIRQPMDTERITLKTDASMTGLCIVRKHMQRLLMLRKIVPSISSFLMPTLS